MTECKTIKKAKYSTRAFILDSRQQQTITIRYDVLLRSNFGCNGQKIFEILLYRDSFIIVVNPSPSHQQNSQTEIGIELK